MSTVEQDGKIFVGKSAKPEYLTLKFAALLPEPLHLSAAARLHRHLAG